MNGLIKTANKMNERITKQTEDYLVFLMCVCVSLSFPTNFPTNFLTQRSVLRQENAGFCSENILDISGFKIRQSSQSSIYKTFAFPNNIEIYNEPVSWIKKIVNFQAHKKERFFANVCIVAKIKPKSIQF